MKRSTKAQWLSLIEEFEQSGLTQVQFCAEPSLNPKYFNLASCETEKKKQNKTLVEAVAVKPRIDRRSDDSIRSGLCQSLYELAPDYRATGEGSGGMAT